MRSYYVIDVETTVNTTSKDKRKCGLGTPFDDNNRIVAFGITTAETESPILFYEGEEGVTYVRLSSYFQTLFPDDVSPDRKAKSAKFISKVAEATMIVGHNIAFDICHILRNTAMNQHIEQLRKSIVYNKIVVWDTMLVEYILSGQSWRYPSLDAVCTSYNLPTKDGEVKVLWESGCKTEDIPREMLLEYLQHDVEVTEAIFKKQRDLVQKLGIKNLVYDELRARMATIIAEHNGMAFDRAHAMVLHEKLGEDIDCIERELIECLFKHNNISDCSTEFKSSINFASHDQVSAMLFGGKLKWKEQEEQKDENGCVVFYKSGAKTGTVKYKKVDVTKELKSMYVPKQKWRSKKLEVFYTSDEVLSELASDTNRFVALIKEHRQARKERDTYLSGLTKVCWDDGLLHPTFNHVETPTGRLSCRNPNLQNITTNR